MVRSWSRQTPLLDVTMEQVTTSGLGRERSAILLTPDRRAACAVGGKDHALVRSTLGYACGVCEDWGVSGLQPPTTCRGTDVSGRR